MYLCVQKFSISQENDSSIPLPIFNLFLPPPLLFFFLPLSYMSFYMFWILTLYQIHSLEIVFLLFYRFHFHFVDGLTPTFTKFFPKIEEQEKFINSLYEASITQKKARESNHKGRKLDANIPEENTCKMSQQ